MILRNILLIATSWMVLTLKNCIEAADNLTENANVSISTTFPESQGCPSFPDWKAGHVPRKESLLSAPLECPCMRLRCIHCSAEEPVEVVGYELGDRCEMHCSENLSHALCNSTTKQCVCEPTHPIPLNNFICIEPLHLGEICIYELSCMFYDRNSLCVPVSPYYSRCACKEEYHLKKNIGGQSTCIPGPTDLLDADVPTVFVVGIALSLFSGLTCLVLKLFSRARFGQPRGHYANANISPPIMMTGMSTPVSAPPSRRSSGRSSSTQGSRRPSYSMLAPPSRPGSRRPSTVSVRSQTSIRSYRYDRGHHESLRATMSAPIGIGDLSSPSKNIRILEQKFAQHAGYIRREAPSSRPASRHSSQEIITEVISEAPEKA